MDGMSGLTIDDLFVGQTESLPDQSPALPLRNVSGATGAGSSGLERSREANDTDSAIPRERYENSCLLLEYTRRTLVSIGVPSDHDVKRLATAYLKLETQEAELHRLARERQVCAVVRDLDDAGVLTALKYYKLIEKLKSNTQ